MNAFLLLQWCSLPSPGLIGMSQSTLTQASSHPSADWSAFPLLCLSASPGLANNIRSCILLYALFPLCTFFRAPERLPLLVQRGESYSFLAINLMKSAEALHPYPGRASTQVTPAEKGMAVSWGGNLLGAKFGLPARGSWRNQCLLRLFIVFHLSLLCSMLT